MMIEKKKILSTLVIITLIATVFFNVQTSTVVLRPFVIIGDAGANEDSSWDNSTYLNVTVESKRPRILWYDFQKCTTEKFNGGWNSSATDELIENANWVSKRNNMTEVDNETWYRFIINISSDQGWDNIEYINITGWHDNGTLESGDDYNNSDNMGANRNFRLYYENITGTAYYNRTYPRNNTEITIGNFSERNVTDNLGITDTETRNISFCFKPGFQFRYAAGPGEGDLTQWDNDTVSNVDGFPTGDGYHPGNCSWISFDNPWSWNFNITVENKGEDWDDSSGDGDGVDRYEAWVNDEFGIYAYTEIVSAEDATIEGAPGDRYSTNGSSHFNSNSGGESANVTVQIRSNGNYSMTVNITHLYHRMHFDNPLYGGDAEDIDPQTDPNWADNKWDLQINNSQVYVRGGNLSDSTSFGGSTGYDNTTSNCVWLYGYGSVDGGTVDAYQIHEVNGTYKWTGEDELPEGTDQPLLEELFPNHYTWDTYGSHNENSTSIEFAVEIPQGQIAGLYTARVYYHLRTETNT